MAVAILDSDTQTVNILSELVADMGLTPAPFSSKDQFLEHIDPKQHEIAIISEEFLDVLEGTKQVYPEIECLATGWQAASDHCARLGASLLLKKPFKASEMREALTALSAKPTAGAAQSPELIAVEPAMLEIIRLLDKVAPTQAPVLIQGESGTGKEVLARYIHNHSKRGQGPYVGINLAAIPETLLESELFGYEKGAFTGAYATRAGKFELADGGTILLDEITEIGKPLQAKLLRVLQEREVERVGARKPIILDIRVIATTNRDIEAEVRDGNFRQDLFFRLNVIPVHIPALRERPADILPLAEHFIGKIARREGIKAKSLSAAAKAAILGYAWPGNVRELENVIERAMILADGQEIDAGDILLTASAPRPAVLATPGQTIHEMEKNLIMSTLNQVDGNRTRAAELLGISIRTLRNKLNEYKQGGQISDTDTD